MSFNGRIGTAFHRTLEWLSGLPSDDKPPNDVAAEVRARFAHELRTQESQAEARPRERGLPRNEKRVHLAAEALISAAHRVRGSARASHPRSEQESYEADPVASDHTKGEAEVEVSVRSSDGLFTGKVDRAEHTAEGVRIVDYKSALLDELPGRYERQVQLYASMWRDTRGEYPVEATVVYPLRGTAYTVELSPEISEQVAREYKDLLASMEDHPAYDLGTPGDTCKICEFRPWCKPFWHWQARERNAPVALERAYLGFEGAVDQIEEVQHHWRVMLRWRNAFIRLIAPVERFPQLRNVEAGSRLRVLEASLRGLRHRPTATVTEYTEIFVLERG